MTFWYIPLKSSVFCDIAPCSILEVNRRFRGTWRVNLQGPIENQTRNQPEIEGDMHPDTSIDFRRATRRHIPETELFITAAVRT
jgi:hypothetical protein